MSTPKNNKPIKLEPVNDPENILYYTELLKHTGLEIQEALNDKENISKAIMNATCKQYRDLRESISFCLCYLAELANTSIDDFSNEF